MYKQGDKVEYDVVGTKGEALIVGLAITEQMTIGKAYILQDISGKFPNDDYPYTHFICFECWMKPV